MNHRRFFALLLALGMTLALLSGCRPSRTETTATPSPEPPVTAEVTPAPTPTPEPTQPLAQEGEVRVSMLKGPTGLGAAKLMAEAEAGETGVGYTFTVMAEATEAVAALTKGEVDIAAVPTNLASTLYHRLDGGVQLLCLNTLGVLYILENGDTVHSLGDLRGRTVHAFGQGANPEFVLNYLLEKSGLVPGEDVTVQWYATTDEVTTAMAAGEIDLCMLPVPAATSVLIQNSDVRSAVDLNDAWTAAGAEGILTMGCAVVRTEFAQEHPELVNAFLSDYERSIAFMADSANLDEAAQLAETYGIVPKAAVAKRALPDASLCFLTGDDMMDGIQGYYQVLYQADPSSIGGSIPDGAFYYGG